MSDIDANDPLAETAPPLSEQQLREIINDPAMSLEEKQALLEEYARATGVQRSEGEAALEPLEAQIAEALALLGAGGHRTG